MRETAADEDVRVNTHNLQPWITEGRSQVFLTLGLNMSACFLKFYNFSDGISVILNIVHGSGPTESADFAMELEAVTAAKIYT